MQEENGCTAHPDNDAVDECLKLRTARQSKRRKRSQARKAIEHGEALDIPTLTLELCIHRSESLTLRQLEKLVCQFGYVPYNLIEIGSISADEDQVPQVAVLYPMNKSLSSGRYAKDWLPFPTMLWLSCPKLHTLICELEVDGWVDKLQTRLQSSEEHLEAMRRAHQSYAEERWRLLTDEDRERVEQNGWTKSLRDNGVAGMREFSAVKCLHCHYAHFLARPHHGNVIGEWVQELLDQKAAAGDITGR